MNIDMSNNTTIIKKSFTIYANIKLENDVLKKYVVILEFDNPEQLNRFKNCYWSYRNIEGTFVEQYGGYSTFEEIRDIFDESDIKREEQLILTNNNETIINNIKEFIRTIANGCCKSYFSAIKDITDYHVERKTTTIEYNIDEL